MIRFRAISLQGFRSFESDQLFRFPSRPQGFYLLTGENRLEPDLGANGVGKSSLWDGLSWCLYGKTTRGGKAGAVSNRKGENLTSVVVEFERDGQVYGVTRTWSPNSLVLDEEGKEPRNIPQEELDHLIGINYEGFLFSVVVGQFNQLFFDLSPTEKLNLLSGFLELEVWAQGSERAKERAKEAEEHAAQSERSVAQLQGRWESLEEAKKQTKLQEEEFAAAQKTQLARQRDALGEAIRGAEAAERAYDKAQEAYNAAVRKAKEADQTDRLLRERRSELATKVTELDAERRNAERAEEELLEQVEHVEALEGECPTCLQEVNAKHRGSVLKELSSRLEALKEARDTVEEKADKAKARLHKHEAEIEVVQQNRVTLDDALEGLRQKFDGTARNLGAKRSERKNLEHAIAETRERTNPYTAQLARNERDLDDVIAKLETAEATANRKKEAATGFTYWVTRFKDIRLWVVEQALSELELHVNNALGELGLHGYRIAFDIERPRSDGGGVIRGFHVLITSPEATEPIPWESFSGGETQRLRIAGAIGIADLLCARTGFESSIEVWDEPTAHLSQEGIDDLLAYLAVRSRARQKQVWLVDHRALSAGDFDDEIRVVKDEFGSHIVQRERAKTGRPKRVRAK